MSVHLKKKGGFKHIYEFILDNVVSDNEPDLANEPEFVNEPDIANEQELANEPDLANELELVNDPGLANEPDQASAHLQALAH